MTKNKLKLRKYASFAWISNAQFFLVQVIVALAFKPTYSISSNTISDLGNTECAVYGAREVCSSLNVLMNLSFVVLGITIIVGAYYFWKIIVKDNCVRYGIFSLAVSGLGSILVGLFPENTVHAGHLLGAGLSFIFGNIGIILISLSRTNAFTKIFRVISVVVGLIALMATVLIATNNYLYLGIGGIERIAAYTQTTWMIIFGALILCRQERLK